MIKLRLAAAGALLAVAGAAHADFTVTPTLTSDYDFRGFTQTAKKPAFQVGGTYTHASGFYGGIWASNVDFGPGKPNVEMDYSAGYAGGDAKEAVAYDVGVIRYTYVNRGLVNYNELYVGLTHGWFGGKVWYSPDFGGKSTSGKTPGVYTEGNGTFPLPQDFGLTAHIGYSFGKVWKPNEYIDWSVGATKNLGNFGLSLRYIDGSDFPDTPGTKVFDTRGKVVFAISTTLPWKAP